MSIRSCSLCSLVGMGPVLYPDLRGQVELDGCRVKGRSCGPFDPVEVVEYTISRMNRAEFMSHLRNLEGQLGGEVPNTACLNSKNLQACSRCMFSSDLESCYHLTHCHGCRNCSHLSHSTGCGSCHDSAYLTDCRSCTGSAYLIHCFACVGCNYCVGCVGLQKKDFHILNEPYSRSEYFEILKKLKRELGLR